MLREGWSAENFSSQEVDAEGCRNCPPKTVGHGLDGERPTNIEERVWVYSGKCQIIKHLEEKMLRISGHWKCLEIDPEQTVISNGY